MAEKVNPYLRPLYDALYDMMDTEKATRLMLAHVFGLGYRRVEWKCDARNERSRRAALSYGFTFEGIQQYHYIVKGRSRDTAWYRMLDVEWSP